jgi:hypothetical protein
MRPQSCTNDCCSLSCEQPLGLNPAAVFYGCAGEQPHRVSERRACQGLGLHRHPKRRQLGQGKRRAPRVYRQALSERYPRVGYRQIVALLKREAALKGLSLGSDFRRIVLKNYYFMLHKTGYSYSTASL